MAHLQCGSLEHQLLVCPYINPFFPFTLYLTVSILKFSFISSILQEIVILIHDKLEYNVEPNHHTADSKSLWWTHGTNMRLTNTTFSCCSLKQKRIIHSVCMCVCVCDSILRETPSNCSCGLWNAHCSHFKRTNGTGISLSSWRRIVENAIWECSMWLGSEMLGKSDQCMQYEQRKQNREGNLLHLWKQIESF